MQGKSKIHGSPYSYDLLKASFYYLRASRGHGHTADKCLGCSSVGGCQEQGRRKAGNREMILQMRRLSKMQGLHAPGTAGDDELKKKAPFAGNGQLEALPR